MKNIALFIAVFILGLSLAQPVQASDFKKPLHFAPGKNSAIVSAAVVEGTGISTSSRLMQSRL